MSEKGGDGGRWTLYCITQSNRMRTYVGITVNLDRRLRQHNGLIKGGAKATMGGNWQLLYTIAGFPNKKTIMQWEWRLHRKPKRRTASCACCRRLHALKQARAMERVSSKAIANKDLRLRVYYHRMSKFCRINHLDHYFFSHGSRIRSRTIQTPMWRTL